MLLLVCCRYVSSNPQYADASSYASKFRQLQQRAMATMRTKVAQVLQHASEQVSYHPCTYFPWLTCTQRLLHSLCNSTLTLNIACASARAMNASETECSVSVSSKAKAYSTDTAGTTSKQAATHLPHSLELLLLTGHGCAQRGAQLCFRVG